ncbi:MAG: ABC transporter ATP-binding protein [Kineosporiaceae bacterium]
MSREPRTAPGLAGTDPGLRVVAVDKAYGGPPRSREPRGESPKSPQPPESGHRRGPAALQAVSLVVPAGELLAILGPSGGGKSTLLKVVAGVERPDRGQVLLDGRDVTAAPAHRREVVLMFQRAHLFPFLSIVDNVSFGLRVRGTGRRAARREAERLLDVVGLAGTGRRRPEQLSGGEQQRVALARALATRPRALLLDEPFTGLDPAVRRAMQDTVRGIHRELGVTTVLVTHDRSEALAMADRILLLDGGRALAAGPPRDVVERPPSRRAAELVGVEVFLPGTAVGAGAGTWAIRPEHVRLAGGPGPGTVAGQVVDRVYRGEYTEVVVATAIGRLRARAAADAPVPQAGEPGHVRLGREHLFRVGDGE